MNANSPSATDALKSNLGEAGSLLKQAASSAGDTIKGAATLSGDDFRLGKAELKAGLADTGLAALAAAEALPPATREQVDMLMEKGEDLIDSAAELIRERPLAAFGMAFAAGWIIAKLGRSGSDK